MNVETPSTLFRHPALAWAVGLLGIALIGVVDYGTGVEVRIFPLYYAPLAVLATQSGRLWALVATALCAASWALSNYLAPHHGRARRVDQGARAEPYGSPHVHAQPSGLLRGDSRMYSAKAGGRNRVSLHVVEGTAHV